jgi:hypothetical protein
MNSKENHANVLGTITRENIEGLAKLANEDEAGEMREHAFRRKLKRIYRKYVKRPKATPVEV